VTEQLLYRSDICAGFEQVGGETVPQRVATDRFRDIGLARRIPDGTLQGRLVQVVTPCFPGGRFDVKARCRK